MRISPWAVLYWCTVLAAFGWCGWVYILEGVSEFYHPMAARGDLLQPFRKWAILLPIVPALLPFILWRWRGWPGPGFYVAGLSMPVAAMLVSVVPSIDNGHHEVYWLNETKHEIPWQFSPYNGSSQPGGEFFLIQASPRDLSPRYGTGVDTIRIGKAIDFNYGKGGAPHPEPCQKDVLTGQMRCEWRREAFVYSASGTAALFPSDMAPLMDGIVELLDGFEAAQP